MVISVVVQLKQDEDVVGQPADEESSYESAHHFEGFGGFYHSIVSKFEDDDRVADDDDDERKDKACDEAAHCNNLVQVWVRCVIIEAACPTLRSSNISIDHRGNAQPNGKKPSKDNHHRRLLNGAVVLSPNWKHNRHAAVYTDDNEEEDAAEHVEEHHPRRELAHEEAKDPLLHHHEDDVERKEGTEEKVRDGKAQVPCGVDCLLHLEARDPDDQTVPNEAQQENDHVDDSQSHTHAVL